MSGKRIVRQISSKIDTLKSQGVKATALTRGQIKLIALYDYEPMKVLSRHPKTYHWRNMEIYEVL